MPDLIVIGAGPAALAAAFYAAGKRLDVVMLYEDLGGKIGWLNSVAQPEPDQPVPGHELVSLLTRTVTALPDHTINDRVVRVDRSRAAYRVVTAAHGTVDAPALIVATGATPVRLAIPGADRFAERGLGYSITTYAHLTAGQRVAVIGANARAISGAAELATTAARVTLVAPGALPAATALAHLLQVQDNVVVLEHAAVRELVGDERLEALVIEQAGRVQRVAVDRVFVTLGVVPNSAVVRGLVDTDAAGFIRVNAFHETSAEGIFAAGDVCTIFAEQVLAAIGDGARAALHAYDYVLARRLAA